MKQQDDKTSAPPPRTTEPTKKATKPQSPKQNDGEESLVDYFKGVRTEWTKVSWPTSQQIIAQSLVVLVMVTVMTLGLWGVDSLFRAIIGFITPSV